jgi:hypothetical protein
MRKQFKFYKSYYDVAQELSYEDRLDFLDAIFQRQFFGIEPDKLKGMAKFAYLSQKHSIDTQVTGYEDATKTKLLICENEQLQTIENTAIKDPLRGGIEGPMQGPLGQHTTYNIQQISNNSLFDSVFDSFLVMRKQLKKPMTDKAIELLKSKLEKLAPADEQTQIEILEQSIMNNWQGVFPLKDSAKKEGANGILLKDCDIDVLPNKDIHRVKYRAVVGFYVLFTDIAEKIKRNDNLDLLNSADLGVWMYDIDQIEKEHEFDTFKLFTIGVYLKEILYDDQLHFDIDSITSLKDLYGRYSNGKSKFLRVSRDADKYIDKFDMWQKVRTANEFING